MTRREFLAAAAAAPFAGPLTAAGSEWGTEVTDIHVHPRRGGGSCAAHLDGSGVARAVILARVNDAERVKAEIAASPGRFVWFASGNPAEPGMLDKLRDAVAKGGAKGFGEMKNHLAADGPEMRKVYDLAAEMKVPVLVHFQEVEHFAGEGDWNTGYQQFEKILKAYPKVTFIGHADFFWSNISADEPSKVAYPATKVKRGGLTDKWLKDYANLYGDLSANSGFNGLTRDPDFTRAFLERHQSKLMFGCDCSCQDGRGTGGSPILPQLKGKCVARETLAVLKKSTTPAVFRKIARENAARVIGIGA